MRIGTQSRAANRSEIPMTNTLKHLILQDLLVEFRRSEFVSSLGLIRYGVSKFALLND
jgi:hypothetical protein